jgi:glutaredoxin
MQCPKCGYRRKPKETVADGQCPSCGVYYAKLKPADADAFLPKPIVYAEEKKSFPLFRITAVVAIAAAAWFIGPQYLLAKLAGAGGAGGGNAAALRGELLAPDGRTPVRDLDLRGVRIEMYSLTTCIYCRELRHVFEANGVPFREYFIDQDMARQQELFAKLQTAGFQGGGIGTPTLDVNGVMLPNNPSLDEILKAATGGIYKRRA